MGTLPGPPLAGLASLGLGPPPQKDWDQMSMYSQRTDRSVPRARMYHAGKCKNRCLFFLKNQMTKKLFMCPDVLFLINISSNLIILITMF